MSSKHTLNLDFLKRCLKEENFVPKFDGVTSFCVKLKAMELIIGKMDKWIAFGYTCLKNWFVFVFFFVKVRLTMISRMAKPEEVGMES